MPEVKKQFSIFQTNPNLVYLDNASTTQMPEQVLGAVHGYYTTYKANIHRGLYDIAARADETVDISRKAVAEFINAKTNEIVFTSGTTASLNALAQMLESSVTSESNIVLTRLEHHANLIPWQELAKRVGCELRFIDLTDDGLIDVVSAKQIIDENTAVLSFSLVSNTLGSIAPAEELIALAKKVEAVTIVDAAQAAVHMPIDVKKLDCDFLVFSGHKMYGPTGVGVLYGKQELLSTLNPVQFGGDMINTVDYEHASWADVPQKFEAGTQNIAGIIGLGAAVTFLQQIGWDDIRHHEAELTQYALDKLMVFGVNIVGPNTHENRLGVLSFTVNGIHPHDVAEVLNRDGVAVRAGHHCTMPLMEYLGLNGTVRASIGVYNSKEDIDRLCAGIRKAKELFS